MGVWYTGNVRLLKQAGGRTEAGVWFWEHGCWVTEMATFGDALGFPPGLFRIVDWIRANVLSTVWALGLVPPCLFCYVCDVWRSVTRPLAGRYHTA
ncbi:hypothetical protein M427DRAFT_239446 [Gonapodya prolifera JEL478]|uniref:Uncharacterized protein n=1 Tax=Gonapodya prolifera (strain JEL478) TaxID=1344416 RepID=A0A138ZXS0_GONPJ|nr:hypothetical protein M427DRAFT_239446 [Gonapodya prolifera JEL478]|eukprot:KXS09297.1 hypothetical protein M427DRAFT_239446 [Gonapodya prolifera JEL478]